MTTNRDNDTSERSGCQRKRTAGEMPMSDLTNHTHGGFYIVQFTRRGEFESISSKIWYAIIND